MALTNGPNLGILINGNAGEEHYDELMAQWRGLDLLVMPVVLDADLTAPPGSPSAGDAYIVGLSPTGAWAGKALQIARWSGSAWEFYPSKNGWRCHILDEQRNVTMVDGQWVTRECPLLIDLNNQGGTTYTLAIADSYGKVVRFTGSSAVTLTVPLSSSVAIPYKSVITIRQVGTGQVTITPSGGVTLNAPANTNLKTARQGAVVMLHKVGADAWDLTGDLEAA